ncbi:MAG: UDP-N-acetylmuramoyl-L-alanine--D-glutamate ligase [Chloroflexaceae bacterium]|jgi:UDP-N-acetylmuramoylalanine--D-glutamate ligase|nr:UDP-N-acetylmuramoyl-L-alanine--D-glutamate ligase [Chloroflexaceae bacterium]
MELRNRNVLVMGLGVHGGGLGVACWLLRQGANVTITDMANAEALATSIAALHETEAETGNQARYVLGEHRMQDFTGADVLVANPAVRPDSPWLTMARSAGVQIETEMTLFFRRCPGPILGVTGTKGKTTTATLLGAMLRQQHPDVVLAGNLRVSALEALERVTAQTPVVLELSSFQLVGLGEAGLSPKYALITNLSSDHLNYHGSMEAYAEAKRQIYWHQPIDGAVVLNGGDDGSVEWFPLFDAEGQGHGGRVIYVAGGTSWSKATSRFPQPVVRVVHPTVEAQGNTAIWREAAHAFGATPSDSVTLFERADMALAGDHNFYNAMLAAALAYAFGISPANIRSAVQHFTGVEHRLELVRELDGVRYINDTTATNPAAALAALATVQGPLVLLAGGADKNLDFDAFAAAMVRRAKALVLLEGSATQRLQGELRMKSEELRNEIGDEQFSILNSQFSTAYSDFAAAIHAARALAKPGDTVLLSPGCASFGMFRNEFHRGEEFRRIVSELRTMNDER